MDSWTSCIGFSERDPPWQWGGCLGEAHRATSRRATVGAEHQRLTGVWRRFLSRELPLRAPPATTEVEQSQLLPPILKEDVPFVDARVCRSHVRMDTHQAGSRAESGGKSRGDDVEASPGFAILVPCIKIYLKRIRRVCSGARSLVHRRKTRRTTRTLARSSPPCRTAHRTHQEHRSRLTQHSRVMPTTPSRSKGGWHSFPETEGFFPRRNGMKGGGLMRP